DPRRLLPDRPAVVVTLRRDQERGRKRRRPGTRERRREVGVVGLHHDLPGVTEVADDHAATPSPASCSTWAITSSTETTSPYLVSMSYRFASCASALRSPTASRGTAGR